MYFKGLFINYETSPIKFLYIPHQKIDFRDIIIHETFYYERTTEAVLT